MNGQVEGGLTLDFNCNFQNVKKYGVNALYNIDCLQCKIKVVVGGMIVCFSDQ